MSRITSYRLATIAFCLAVVVSAALLVPATLNYLEFYVAVGKLHLRINLFNVYTGSEAPSQEPVIGANLSIVQATSYGGLGVLSVDVIAYYDEEMGYSRELFSRKFTFHDQSLGSYSALDLIIANNTYLNDYGLFADYNNQSAAKGAPVKLLFVSDINLYLLGNTLPNTVNLDDVIYQMPYYVS